MSKKNSENTTIKELVAAFLDKNNLSGGLNHLVLQKYWKEIMGTNIASYTENLYLRGTVLYVKFSSCVLREELNHQKQEILCKMQNKIRETSIETITKIVLI